VNNGLINNDFLPGENPKIRIFKEGTFVWSESKEQIWASLQPRLETPKQREKILKRLTLPWLGTVAALALILLSLTFYARYFSKTLHSPLANHLTVQLPDGSTVNLNAESTVRFHPYWWRFKRVVHFSGEGYFEVKPGKKFEVQSEMGNTAVLGTRFNIFARDNTYRVTCLSGSVKVSSKQNHSMVLEPNQKAEIDERGQIKKIMLSEPHTEIAWKNYLFFFTATPINEVLREIERQYGVKLKNTALQLNLYTGNFKKENHVEEVLKVVCLPMGLGFKKLSKDEYLIFQSN